MHLKAVCIDVKPYNLKFGELLQLTESNLGLHAAVADSDVDLVKQFLVEGADPCAKDEQVCAIAAL